MKKRSGITDRDVERWIKEGYGQGVHKAYKRWIDLRDVPSTGTSFRLPSLLGAVEHHYLSLGEYHTHHFAEFGGATWIYDQIALLPRDETHEIALALGLPPRFYPGSRARLVLSTDLYVEHPAGDRAFWVKDPEHMPKEKEGIFNMLVTLAIETEYWRRRGVTLYPVLKGRTYNIRIAENLVKYRAQMIGRERDPLMAFVPEYEAALPKIWAPDIPRIDLHREIGGLLGLSPAEVMAIEGRLIWTRRLPVDLTVPWELEQPLALTPVHVPALINGLV